MSPSPPEQHRSGPASRLGRDLTLYLLARFGLIVIVAVILAFLRIPLIVALAGGFIVGIPLGFLVLRPLNRRVSAGLARREQQRAELRSQLRGDSEAGAAQQPGDSSAPAGSEDSNEETRDEDTQ